MVVLICYNNRRPLSFSLSMMPHSSLSSVEPPQVWFDLKLPSHVVEEVQLSSLQLEAVVYACQQHMNILSDGSRAGFLVGEYVHVCVCVCVRRVEIVRVVQQHFGI